MYITIACYGHKTFPATKIHCKFSVIMSCRGACSTKVKQPSKADFNYTFFFNIMKKKMEGLAGF